MKRMNTILVTGLVLLTLSACGSEGSTATTTITPSKVETSESNISAEAPSAGNSEVAERAEATGDELSESAGTAESASAASIDETVILEEGGVKVTARSLSVDGIFGPEIKLLIENDSGQDLTFQSRNVSVNGYMVDTMMSVDVQNGKKANDSLTLMTSSLEKCGIKTIADIEFALHVFDSAGWDTYIDTEPIVLATSAQAGYSYSYDDSGDLVYDGNGVKIVVKGLSEDDSIFGPGIIIYAENTGSKDVTTQVRDVSINGFMVDAMFSCDLPIGKHAIDSITFMSSSLEENGIENISDVELSFHVFDMDGWDTIVDTDPVTIHF